MRLTEILFPTDFSPASEAAGGIARTMARQAGARLHLLHVVPPVTDPTLRREPRAEWAGITNSLRVNGCDGWASRNIVDYAREACRPHRGRLTGAPGSHAILGSVAETVVRLACLVLTVPASLLAELHPGRAARGRGGLAAVPGLRRDERRIHLRGLSDPHPGRGARAEARRRAARPPGAAGMTGPEKNRPDAPEEHPRH
jgi:hypothetical protein